MRDGLNSLRTKKKWISLLPAEINSKMSSPSSENPMADDESIVNCHSLAVPWSSNTKFSLHFTGLQPKVRVCVK